MFNILEKANNEQETQSENKTKYPDDEKILAQILELNETINMQDSQGFTALHRACKQGNTIIVQTMEIQKKTHQVEIYFQSGQVDIVEILLRNGANVTLLTNSNDTALFFAAQEGRFTICLTLIRNGADINFANSDGRTPLHQASENGFYSNFTQISIKFLLTSCKS